MRIKQQKEIHKSDRNRQDGCSVFTIIKGKKLLDGSYDFAFIRDVDPALQREFLAFFKKEMKKKVS